MSSQISSRYTRQARVAPLLALLASLPACTAIGSALSPYPEKFSCKNSDHGQCIHPDKAYADAKAGRPSRSDPAVTLDKAMLREPGSKDHLPVPSHGAHMASPAQPPYLGYRDSVYRELQGLLDAPVTPMLREGRSVRTLILPYADRERPDRLYMPRYIYSMVETPRWVLADYLVNPIESAARVPVLEQSKEKPGGAYGEPTGTAPAVQP